MGAKKHLGDDCSGLAEPVTRILSEQSPTKLYVFAASKPGRASKAVAELLDLVLLSGCPPKRVLSNRSGTVLAVELTRECANMLVKLVKSRGVEELASLKLCKGPYTSQQELLAAAGQNSFRVNFRESSQAFASLRGGPRSSRLSAEIFGDVALLCFERLV